LSGLSAMSGDSTIAYKPVVNVTNRSMIRVSMCHDTPCHDTR